ncbi:MAG: hypothetical protein KF891_22545 [Rhizobacter sp.]|nr:hypothetical protein [Rhizobacter sp.]
MPRLDAELTFRESDFAGMAPQTQAELSGSLNQLSEQIAATRKLLKDIGPGPVVPAPPQLPGVAIPGVPSPGESPTPDANARSGKDEPAPG